MVAETCPDAHVDRCRLRGPHHSASPRRPPGHGPIEHVEPNSRSGRRRAFGAKIGFLLMSSRYRRVSERQPTRDPPRTIPSEGTEHSRSIHRRQDERVQAVPASKVKHLRGLALPHHVQQRHIESLDRRPADSVGQDRDRLGLHGHVMANRAAAESNANFLSTILKRLGCRLAGVLKIHLASTRGASTAYPPR